MEIPHRSQGLGPGFILFAGAERFQVGNDAPPVEHIDGGGQGRLPSIGSPVADRFKEFPFWKGQDFQASQVCWKGMEALSDRSVSVMVFSVTLSAIGEIEGLSPFDTGWIILL